MTDTRPPPSQRHWGTFSARTAAHTQEPSKEDVELAQHLLGHSQEARDYSHKQDHQTTRDSGPPAQERPSSRSTMSPSGEQVQLVTPRSHSSDRGQAEDSKSYAPGSSHPDSILSGQVCR